MQGGNTAGPRGIDLQVYLCYVRFQDGAISSENAHSNERMGTTHTYTDMCIPLGLWHCGSYAACALGSNTIKPSYKRIKELNQNIRSSMVTSALPNSSSGLFMHSLRRDGWWCLLPEVPQHRTGKLVLLPG